MKTYTTSLRLISDRLAQTTTRMVSAARPRFATTQPMKRDKSSHLVPLAERTILTLPVPSRGIEVELLTGSVWVTQLGDRSDYVLEQSGARFRSTGRNEVHLQALKFSRVVVR